MSKILFLVSEDWFFWRHFQPMLAAAQAAGLESVVAGNPGACVPLIETKGARFVALQNERRSKNPLSIVKTLWSVARVIGTERPAILHCISLKTAVIASLAARVMNFRGKIILAPTGLGHLWIDQSIVSRLVRGAVRLLIGKVMRTKQTTYLFENRDDPREFGLDPDAPCVAIVDGAGVDPMQFPPAPMPGGTEMTIAIVSRMLKPKGIAEAIEAVTMARRAGAPVSLHLFGGPDPGNPTSLTNGELQAFAARPGITWHGDTRDAGHVYRTHHVAMLLSHREGLPRTLVEAAASARPIIASDVPGCRAIVRDGIEGFLVPLDELQRIAERIARMAKDTKLRERMGAAARKRFEECFTEEHVRASMQALYARVMP